MPYTSIKLALAKNDSAPSVDDSHAALNHMPKQLVLRKPLLSAFFPFPLPKTVPATSETLYHGNLY